MEIRPRGFVLVGGNSRRMGSDKALLEVDGEPLVLRTVRLLRTCLSEVTLLGPSLPYLHFNMPILEDQYSVKGPLAALCTGLKYSAADWNVFLACDLPFVSESFMERLLTRISQTDAEAVIPYAADRPQVLCAAYRRSCLPIFERSIGIRNPTIMNMLAHLKVEIMKPEETSEVAEWERIFWNINTPEDWVSAKAKIEVTP